MTAPAIMINGLKPNTINVSIQEFVNAKIKDILTVEKFIHITAQTPEIILLSWYASEANLVAIAPGVFYFLS